jgi:hypothetical protein
MIGFVIRAVVGKIAVLRARGVLRGFTLEAQATYLEHRAARSAKGRLGELVRPARSDDPIRLGQDRRFFAAWNTLKWRPVFRRPVLVGKAGSADTVLPGDEFPDGWLPEQDSHNGATSEPHGLNMGR